MSLLQYQISWLVCFLSLSLFGQSVFAQQEAVALSDSGPSKPQRTFTAPNGPQRPQQKKQDELPLVYAAGEEIAPPEYGIPKFVVSELLKGNELNMAPGYYASFKPRVTDTLFLFDSASDHFDEVQIHAGKEVLQGDSLSVFTDIQQRLGDYDARGNLITTPKRGKTNSLVIRSGFIPAQGFGSKRFRFGVIPGNFKIDANSMITASVHMTGGESIGTVLCAVTKVDYEHNRFYVEASNEVPLGENINWIIVNAP